MRHLINFGSSSSLLDQLPSPFGVTRDSSSGTLYIADSGNHRIMSYLSGASTGTIVAGNSGAGTNHTQLFYPRNVHFDSVTNSLVIVNRGANNVVRRGIGDTRWSLVAGSIDGTAGDSSTLFRQPGNMVFDLLGNMYVSDDQNHRTQLFSSGASEGITIAGVTGTPGNDSEHLYYPSSMALDNQLNLYVVDQYNHRIQPSNTTIEYNHRIQPSNTTIEYNHRIQMFERYWDFDKSLFLTGSKIFLNALLWNNKTHLSYWLCIKCVLSSWNGIEI